MDAERLCEGCGVPLGPSRPNRRHHSAACRKAAFLRRERERETAESGPIYQPPSGQPLDREAVLEEALSEPRLLIYVAQAARTNWRAAAWLLERRHPERWGSKVEPEQPILPGDPFAEVDELAARRRFRPS